MSDVIYKQIQEMKEVFSAMTPEEFAEEFNKCKVKEDVAQHYQCLENVIVGGNCSIEQEK